VEFDSPRNANILAMSRHSNSCPPPKKKILACQVCIFRKEQQYERTGSSLPHAHSRGNSLSGKQASKQFIILAARLTVPLLMWCSWGNCRQPRFLKMNPAAVQNSADSKKQRGVQQRTHTHTFEKRWCIVKESDVVVLFVHT
jgi:hypothetical protein